LSIVEGGRILSLTGRVQRKIEMRDGFDEVTNAGKREPLTAKQKVWFVSLAFLLNIPVLIFLFGYADRFSPKEVGVVGLFNLGLGVPLFALITEKWIRKMK